MKNIIFLYFAVLFSASGLQAQSGKSTKISRKFDKLSSEYQTLPDTTDTATRLAKLLVIDSLANLLDGKYSDKVAICREIISQYAILHDKPNSVVYNNKLLQVAKLAYLSNDTSLIKVYTEVGKTFGSMGEISTAAVILNEGLQLMNADIKLNSNYKIKRVLLTEINRLNFYKGEYIAADSLQQVILDMSRQYFKENSAEYAEDLKISAIIAWYLNQYPRVLSYFNKSKEIYEQLPGGTLSASYLDLLANLGLVYSHLNRLEDSRDIMLKRYNALKANPETDVFQLASGQLDYAMSLFGLKQIDDALVQFIEIHKVYKTLPKYYYSRNNWRCMYFMADCYRLKGNDEEAIRIIKERSTIAKEIPSISNIRDQSRDNLDVGFLLMSMNRFTESRPYLTECLRLEAQNVGKSHLNYIDIEKYLIHLEYMVDKDRLHTAYEMFDSNSVALTKRITDACYYLPEDQLSRIVRLLDGNIDFMFSILERYPSEHDADKTLDLVLYNKGFVLNALARTKNMALQDSTTERDFSALREAQAILAAELSKPESKRTSVEQKQAQVIKLETTLVEKTAALKYSTNQVDAHDIRQALADNEASIEFVLYNYRPNLKDNIPSYGALITRRNQKSSDFVMLCRKSTIDSLLDGKDKSAFEIANSLYGKSELSQLLWKPVLPYLQGINKLFLALDGDLYRLNMGALKIDNKTSIRDRFNITLLNSTRDVLLNKSRQITRNKNTALNALVIGDLEYNFNKSQTTSTNIASTTRGISEFYQPDSAQNMSPWNRIPFSKNEVDDIVSALTRHKVKVELLTGENGREEIIKGYDFGMHKAISPEFIHFSTHGYFFAPSKHEVSPESPAFKVSNNPLLRTGLILSGANSAWMGNPVAGEKEDGVLTALEVSRLNLGNTKLAVLSACETGLGDVGNSEGVYGLRRAFKIAGVEKIVMSLWKVPDYQTKELMVNFYNNMFSRNMEPADALYEAQRMMRQKKYEPYYWAGFVIVE